jgi:hypothetical protein
VLDVGSASTVGAKVENLGVGSRGNTVVSALSQDVRARCSPM